MTDEMETIDNVVLIKNGLEHIAFSLTKDHPSFFRIGKEAHLVLYRSMVEALRGTANLAITGRSKDKKRIVKYRIGDKPWVQIERTDITDCKKAWRYSEPIPTQEPAINGLPFDTSEISNYLQSFYELLAKVQAECFMSHFVGSKPIQINDTEMVLIEWLHDRIRNEFEHFIPKRYYVQISDLIASSILCLVLSYKLFFESHNVIFHEDSDPLRKALDHNIELLGQFQSS